MYKSPIEVYVNNMLNQIRQREENQIVAEVSQAVGLNVEKEELIKALNYDRNQYEKGYEDGKRASKWIPCSERLPEEDGLYLVIGLAIYFGEYSPFIFKREKTSPTNTLKWGDIVAWMPLPEPYKESEDNVCKDCYYNDSDVHAECVICDKAESEDEE